MIHAAKKLSRLRFCLCAALLSGIWVARTQQTVRGELKPNKSGENLYEISPQLVAHAIKVTCVFRVTRKDEVRIRRHTGTIGIPGTLVAVAP